MSKEINYNLVPINFMYCANGNCLQQNNCLRKLALQAIPTDRLIINTFNPAAYPKEGTNCVHFKENTLQRFALGITHLLDNLPHASALEVRTRLISYFGKNMYYRMKRKERYIAPREQMAIAKMFKNCGITENAIFDEYFNLFDWE